MIIKKYAQEQQQPHNPQQVFQVESPQPQNVNIQVENPQQQQIQPVVYVDKQEHVQHIIENTNFRKTLKNLYEHTVLYNDTENERLIYVFDYSAEVIQTDAQNPVALNKESLMYLKANKKWKIIKHPYVFNYINEILLNSANLYIFYVITFSAYLIFLYLYIFTKSFIFGSIASIAGMFMGFMACAKINLLPTVDSKSSKLKSCLYVSSAVFILLSYFIASLWILTSLLLSYDIYLLKQMEDFLWGVQIFVIAASWIQCLYVLKYSFFELYILMLTKILKSFVKMSLAVDDVSELRKFAEEKLLHNKVDYCIQILTLYEFCCCCFCSFDKKQIREILIHSKKDKNVFSKKSTFSASGYPVGIFLNPAIDFSDESYVSLENATIVKLDAQNRDCGDVDKEIFKAYLNKLENDEGCLIKFQRSFFGLNFHF